MSRYDEKALEVRDAFLRSKRAFGIPREIANRMVSETPDHVFESEKSTFLHIDGSDHEEIESVISRLEAENHSKENIESRVYIFVRQNYLRRMIQRSLPGYDLNIYVIDVLNDEEVNRVLNEIGIMEFDVVAGNPPYQSSTGTGNPIWHKFTEKAIKLSKRYLALVHPALWRKPQSKYTKTKDLQPKLFETVKKLSIHDSEDGERVFDAGTRFDFYFADLKEGNGGEMNINDENDETHVIDVDEWPWIPNKNFDLIKKLVASPNKEVEKCNFIGDRSAYSSDSDYVSNEKSKEYNLPIVYTTPKKGVRWKFASKKVQSEDGETKHFGKKKVLFGDSGVNGNAVKDDEGKYGASDHTLAVVCEDGEDIDKVYKALNSETFNRVLSACIWSNYQIDRNLMNEFRRDWYKTVLEIEKNRNDD